MASEENQIRKFRKKLRQIEHLESVRRVLTEDELKKVSTKDAVRAQLKILLSQILQESETRRVAHASRSRFKLPPTPREQSFIEDFVPGDDSSEINRNHTSDLSSCSENDNTMRKRKLEESELEKLQNENNENRIGLNGKQTRREVSVLQGSAVENAVSEIPSTSTSGTRSSEDVRKRYRAMEHAKVVASELKGHSDIVWALASDKNVIVSGSRDTTARVWESTTGEELCSLRGHTGSVNGVALFNEQLSRELATKLESDANQIVLTASTDCSMRLWAIPSGKQLKSIYTFNSITCLGLLEDLFFAVTGTDGGKVEVWDVVSNRVIHSSKAHNESLTCLEVSGRQFCSGSVDGMVIIWTLLNKKIEILYKLEPGANDELPHLSSLKSIASHYGRLFFGDNGSTIKVLSWRRDRMHAVNNHNRPYGCTDALTVFDDLLLSSSYNLDSGLGSINIRLLPEMEYICSVYEKAQKIICLSCFWREDGGLCVVSGGSELVVWDFVDTSQTMDLERYNVADAISVHHLENLDREPEEEESISETTDDDFECTNLVTTQSIPSAQVTRSSWTNWCSLV